MYTPPVTSLELSAPEVGGVTPNQVQEGYVGSLNGYVSSLNGYVSSLNGYVDGLSGFDWGSQPPKVWGARGTKS